MVEGLINKKKEFLEAVSQQSIEELMTEVILDSKEEIIDIQNEQVFTKGLPDEEYSPFTKQIKRAKGQPSDRVTTFDEGDFFAGKEMELSNNSFSLDSRDSKTQKLINQYGEKIFEYDDSSKSMISQDFITPGLTEKIKRRL